MEVLGLLMVTIELWQFYILLLKYNVLSVGALFSPTSTKKVKVE